MCPQGHADASSSELLYYNSVTSLPMLGAIAALEGELDRIPDVYAAVRACMVGAARGGEGGRRSSLANMLTHLCTPECVYLCTPDCTPECVCMCFLRQTSFEAD